VRRHVLFFPWLAAFVAFSCIFLCAPTLSQTVVNTGAVSGVVFDASGASVPAAKVTLKCISTELTQTRATTEQGTFLFPALPVGQ